MLIESPNSETEARLRFLIPVVIVAVGYLVFRLYEIQIWQGSKYTERLKNQTTVPVLLSPARGSILDRNGVPLAENKASFDIDIYLKELVGGYRNAHGRLPETTVMIGSGSSRRPRKMTDIVKIVNESAGDIMETLGLERQFSDRELQLHYYQSPNIPFQLAHDIDFTKLSQFAERSLRMKGIQETARPVRHYNYGALAAHILGYVGKYEEIPDSDFVPEFVGKKGIEHSFDKYLQGTPGSKILRKDNRGYILGVESTRKPRIGGNVYLTLDVRIQYIAEEVMRRVGRGACVVMDVWNGDILAMVSVPNFDPNDFVPTVDSETWQKLTKDPTDPLHDRSISGYAAGSTFKTIVAMAALKNPDIDFTPDTYINSQGTWYWANRFWKDWSPAGRGNINLKTAMQWSCNTFFYQLGVRTGIKSIQEMGELVGLGDRQLQTIDGSPILDSEDPGVMPGPEWMAERGKKKVEKWKERRKEDPQFKGRKPWVETWTDGHTINTSIGQGYVAVTPLQMTVMMAAVANGGTIYYPRLVKGISRLGENGEQELIKDYEPRVRGELGVDPADLHAVQEALKEVVVAGTGRRAGVEGMQVAGKTGTAQFKTRLHGNVVKDNRAWVNGYAPYGEPKYAITVVVEGGAGGGSTAGPIVHGILSRVLEIEKGGSLDMVYLTPSIGHFSGVTEYTPPAEQEDATALPEDFGSALEEERETRAVSRRDPRAVNRQNRGRNN